MLLQPELLQAVEPNVHLVADLLALKSVMPAKTVDTARQVVRRVVEELQRKLAERQGFSLISHKHELYGICADCRRRR